MKVYILGNGVMASAIADGLEGIFEIAIVGRNYEKLKEFNNRFEIQTYNQSYDITDKNIILAFKPYALESVSKILKGKAKSCISVLARTYLKDLDCINSDEKLCCIPNIAAKFKMSTTPYISTNNAHISKKIISGFGQIFEMENEKMLNTAGVISGCVPAYLAVVAESLSNAGVKQGLFNKTSLKIVSSVFASFSKLIQSNHPAILKEQICSPAGTTIKGIKKLEDFKIRSAFFEAVEASCNN